ncbi:MAG: pyridoxamine 5'-phosphate oxidase family protein [Erysipelotrichaceae bacterium]|nr:pyridoxamine 5'-phosphate oxidase family protein [Erysipelotrichaceae bacterium]
MFHELKRIRQKLPEEECIAILKKEKRGVLSVNGDDGYPYGMPLNHYYNEEDGKLYFHGGKLGYKVEMLKKDPKVSYCVYDEGYREEGDWALHIRSVILFGHIEFIEDREKIYDIAARLSRKFTDDEAYIQHVIQHSGPGTLMFALIPEHMTGKIVKES